MRLPVVLFLLCLCVTTSAQDGREILNEMMKRMREHNSLSYTARTESSFISSDTGRAEGIVHLYRDERDSIMGGMVWLSEGIKYDTYSFYDLDKRYVVLKTIHKAWSENMPRTRAMGLNVMANDLHFFPFLHALYWAEGFQKEKARKLSDTTYNGINCYAIERTVPFGDNKYYVEIYYINKADYFPIARIRWQHFGTNIQVGKLEIFNYQFDKAGPEQFSARQIPSDYTIESRDRELPKGAQPQVRPRNEWPVPGNR